MTPTFIHLVRYRARIRTQASRSPTENSSHSTKLAGVFHSSGLEGGEDAICNDNVLHMYSIYLLTPCLVPEKIRGCFCIAFGLTL